MQQLDILETSWIRVQHDRGTAIVVVTLENGREVRYRINRADVKALQVQSTLVLEQMDHR